MGLRGQAKSEGKAEYVPFSVNMSCYTLHIHPAAIPYIEILRGPFLETPPAP